MEGMILAAGAGTRLGTITDQLPKALIQVGGKPLLGWVIEAMATAGVSRIIINTHHHEKLIRDFLLEVERKDIHFALSPEPGGPFETGGGLFHAAPLFERRGPFLLHNADVLSTIPLRSLVEQHETRREMEGHRLIASLAVQRRGAKRRLLFDDLGLLGWENLGSNRAPDGTLQVRDPVGEVESWSFTGIHVVEPAIFGSSQRSGTFSIIELYLELAAAGWIIRPIDASKEEWFDIGTPERLEEARSRFIS